MSIVTGLQSINWYHMRTQLSALKLEMAGIKSGHGSVYAHVKKTYGLSGNKQRVYAQFEQLVKEAERKAQPSCPYCDDNTCGGWCG